MIATPESVKWFLLVERDEGWERMKSENRQLRASTIGGDDGLRGGIKRNVRICGTSTTGRKRHSRNNKAGCGNDTATRCGT